MSNITVIEGQLTAPAGARYAVLCARFNSFIVDALEQGCLDTLRRSGVTDVHVAVVRVPGAFEMPVVAGRLASSGKYDAIIALGAVIRGSTAHFDHVAGGCSRGLADVATRTGVPVIFGVLTTDTIEQAVERAGTKAGNKGSEAAATAIEMVSLTKQL